MTLAKKQGTPLPITQTELETWFERDRSHIELKDTRTDQTIVEWWDSDCWQAFEDGFLPSQATVMGKVVNESLLHRAAYDYAKTHELLPIIAPHFIAGSGEHGCLYDSCHVYRTVQDAVDSLADTFNLGRTRKASLKRSRYLELNPRDGADYCEITQCTCAAPWTHDDSMTENDWDS